MKNLKLTQEIELQKGQIVITDNNYNSVAFIPSLHRNSAKIAKLIVNAPDLLRACETTLAELESMTTEKFQQGGDKAIREMLTAIILK